MLLSPLVLSYVINDLPTALLLPEILFFT